MVCAVLHYACNANAEIVYGILKGIGFRCIQNR